MTKLCPRGKAAAKRKFRVYPSAYANAYASKICAGKIKDPSGVKRKDFRGSKAKGGRIGLKGGLLSESEKSETLKKLGEKMKSDSEISKKDPFSKFRRRPNRNISKGQGFQMGPVPANKRKKFKTIEQINQERTRGPVEVSRTNRAGGGLMEATQRLRRQGLRGGGICTKGMNRDAVGKNS